MFTKVSVDYEDVFQLRFTVCQFLTIGAIFYGKKE